MKNVTRSVRFVLSMVLVMAMVLTSIGSFGTVAKAQTGRAADGLKGMNLPYLSHGRCHAANGSGSGPGIRG